MLDFSNTVGIPVLREDMSEEPVREQLYEMHNYLWQLQEWLDWKLRHLDVEDFSDNKDVLNLVYPVGSVYISVSDTPPDKLFGGKWERIKGRFLLATGDAYAAGQTGGESEHTLTLEEMPEHSHNTWTSNVGTGGSEFPPQGTWSDNPGYLNWWTSSTGGGQPHNNMPPYYVVNMWKRVR